MGLIKTIKTEFAKYNDKGQGMADILKHVPIGFTSAAMGIVKKPKDGKYMASTFKMSPVLQAYQKAFTPRGGGLFNPEMIVTKRVKVDMEWDTDELNDTYWEFLEAGEIQPSKMPLYKFMLDQLYLRIQEDLESEWFYGKTGAITVGTPTTEGASYDGLLVNLKSLTSRINVVNIGGAIDATNIYDKIGLFTDAIPTKHLKLLPSILCSEDMGRMYSKSKLAENLINNSSTDLSIFGTNSKLVGLPSLGLSKSLIATPKENLVTVLKNDQNQGKVQVVEVIRGVQISTNFEVAVGLNFPEMAYMALSAEDIAL